MQLEQLGYRFWLERGNIRYQAGRRAVPTAAALLERVRANKPSAVKFLETRGVYVLIEDVLDYLAVNGYRISPEQTGWPSGAPRPLLIVADDDRSATPQAALYPDAAPVPALPAPSAMNDADGRKA